MGSPGLGSSTPPVHVRSPPTGIRGLHQPPAPGDDGEPGRLLVHENRTARTTGARAACTRSAVRRSSSEASMAAPRDVCHDLQVHLQVGSGRVDWLGGPRTLPAPDRCGQRHGRFEGPPAGSTSRTTSSPGSTSTGATSAFGDTLPANGVEYRHERPGQMAGERGRAMRLVGDLRLNGRGGRRGLSLLVVVAAGAAALPAVAGALPPDRSTEQIDDTFVDPLRRTDRVPSRSRSTSPRNWSPRGSSTATATRSAP